MKQNQMHPLLSMQEKIDQLLQSHKIVIVYQLSIILNEQLKQLWKQIQDSHFHYIGITFDEMFNYQYHFDKGTPFALISEELLEENFNQVVTKVLNYDLESQKYCQYAKPEYQKEIQQRFDVKYEGECVYDTGIDKYQIVDQEYINQDGLIEIKKEEILLSQQPKEQPELKSECNEKQINNGQNIPITSSQPKKQAQPKMKQLGIDAFLKKNK